MARSSKQTATTATWSPQSDGGVAVEDAVVGVLEALRQIPEVKGSAELAGNLDTVRRQRESIHADLAVERRRPGRREHEVKRLEDALRNLEDPKPFDAASRRAYLLKISEYEADLRKFVVESNEEFSRLMTAKFHGELASFEGERLRELDALRTAADQWLRAIANARGELPALVPGAVTTRENALRAAASVLVGIGGLSKQNMATIEALKADVARQLQGIAEAVLTKPYAELAACVEQ